VHRTSLCPCFTDVLMNIVCFCFTISYDEIFDGLPPAPQLVYSNNVEVRHVGVVEQVVHSVSHGCGSGLEKIFHSLNHQIQVSDKPVICLYKCTEQILKRAGITSNCKILRIKE
jgi:hypothetical protein